MHNQLKKFISYTLAVLWCGIILCACNGSGNSTNSINNNTIAGKVELANSAEEISTHSEYAYVLDSTAARIYMYSVSNGILTALTTPYIQLESGSNPSHLTIASDKHVVYVANSASNRISTYAIDQQNGMLSLVETTSVPGSGQVQRVLVTPDGKYAYALSSNNTLATASMYSVNQDNGHLTLLSPGSISLGTYSNTVGVVDTKSMHLYIGNAIPSINPSTKQYDPIKIYNIESNGQLADSGHTTPSAGLTTAMIIRGDTMYIASMDSSSSSVATYKEGRNGYMSYPNVESNVGTTYNPLFTKALAVTHGNNFVYTSDALENKIYSLKQDPQSRKIHDGSLVVTGNINTTNPQAMVLDDSGRYLYVVNYNPEQSNNRSSYSSYSIESHGILAPVVNSDLIESDAMRPTDIAFTTTTAISEPRLASHRVGIHQELAILFPPNTDINSIQASGAISLYKEVESSSALVQNAHIVGGVVLIPITIEVVTQIVIAIVRPLVENFFDKEKLLVETNGIRKNNGDSEPNLDNGILRVIFPRMIVPANKTNVKLNQKTIAVRVSPPPGFSDNIDGMNIEPPLDPSSVNCRTVSVIQTDSNGIVSPIGCSDDKVTITGFNNNIVTFETPDNFSYSPASNVTITFNGVKLSTREIIPFTGSFTTALNGRVIEPYESSSVLLDQKIIIEFPEEVDMSSVNNQTITLVGLGQSSNGSQNARLTEDTPLQLEFKKIRYNAVEVTHTTQQYKSGWRYLLKTTVQSVTGHKMSVEYQFQTVDKDHLIMFVADGYQHHNGYYGNLYEDVTSTYNDNNKDRGILAGDRACNMFWQSKNYDKRNLLFRALVSSTATTHNTYQRYGCSAATGGCGGSNAKNWVLADSATYFNFPNDLTIGTTMANAMFNLSGGLAKFANTITNDSPTDVWTGMDNLWFPSNNNCNGFTAHAYFSPYYGTVGDAGSPLISFVGMVSSAHCNNRKNLICVQQATAELTK